MARRSVILRVNEFFPIPVSGFISNEKCFCDVYIKLEDNHMVRLFKTGQVFERSRFKKESNTVNTLYLRKKDFDLYVKATVRMSEFVSSNPKLHNSQKLTMVNRVAGAVFTQLLHGEVTEESIAMSHKVTFNMLELLATKQDFMLIMQSFDDLGVEFVQHSIATGMVASLIAKELGWTHQKTLTLLSLGGMFHDIGFKKLPSHLINKSPLSMNQKEKELYESHPMKGWRVIEECQWSSR